MFPEPTELLMIGCLMESTWTPRSKLNTLTPRTNSQTYWQRKISHVMNGTIFCVCSTLAISVLQIVLKWCRKERKKMQERKSHSKIEADDEFGLVMQRKESFLTRWLLLHQKALGKPDIKVNFFWARELSSIKEQGDLLKTLIHQATQNGMLIRLVISRVEIWWIDGS